MLDGETAFTLYDTYGFPLDLTQDALRARGIGVDIASFNDAMERQREKARASWAGSGEAAQETVWFGLREKVGATEFLGYETESAEGIVAALVKDGNSVSELKKGDSGAVVMNQTPFYGEFGGQVGDTGEMRREGVRLSVTDTQKKAGDVFVHMVKVDEGAVKIGDPLLTGSRPHAARGHPRRTIPPRIFCTRRCARCSAITWRRKARWSRQTGCASTFRTRSRSRRPNSSASRTSPTTSCCRMRR